MLSIKINNQTILPMRPDAPAKTFSSADVPHGTQSVIYKAIKVHNGNNPQNRVALPQFTEEALAAHKADFLATVEVLPLKDEEGNPIEYRFEDIAENQVMEPTDAEVEEEYYEPLALDAAPDAERQPKMVDSFDMMEMGKVQKYADLDACKVALTEKAKDECAQRLLDKAVDECLIVPELSQEFIDSFEKIEVPEV
jgi:hypothetical protein